MIEKREQTVLIVRKAQEQGGDWQWSFGKVVAADALSLERMAKVANDQLVYLLLAVFFLDSRCARGLVWF